VYLQYLFVAVDLSPREPAQWSDLLLVASTPTFVIEGRTMSIGAAPRNAGAESTAATKCNAVLGKHSIKRARLGLQDLGRSSGISVRTALAANTFSPDRSTTEEALARQRTHTACGPPVESTRGRVACGTALFHGNLRQIPSRAETLSHYMTKIARLGGYLNRARSSTRQCRHVDRIVSFDGSGIGSHLRGRNCG
jgi:hypothetical protein